MIMMQVDIFLRLFFTEGSLTNVTTVQAPLSISKDMPVIGGVVSLASTLPANTAVTGICVFMIEKIVSSSRTCKRTLVCLLLAKIFGLNR